MAVFGLVLLAFAILVEIVFAWIFYTEIHAWIFGLLMAGTILSSTVVIFRNKKKALAIFTIIFSLFIIHFVVGWLPRMRADHHTSICASNLSSLGKALMLYAQEYNNGKLPAGSQWCDALIKNGTSQKLFYCPYSHWHEFSYGFNKELENMDINSVPGDIVVLFEIKGGKNISGGQELLMRNKHENYGSIILLGDMHSQFVKKKEADNFRWKP
jgi:hypothetical protein